MIRDAEIRRIARAAGVEPRIVELDYVLGWALRGLAGHEHLNRRLVFKGGTCLRKCYFPDYRLSEDLDFTATEWFGWDEFEEALGEAFRQAGEASGIDFMVQDPKLRIIDDEYGRESLKFTIYWRGPHPSGGSPHGMRLDITRNEVVLFEPARREVAHDFSDSEELGTVELDCYTLEEVMTEKVRAVLGQRIYAVSRDLYDISSLREHVNDEKVMHGLPGKLAARELNARAVDLRRLTDRKDEFEADWERNLAQLLPPGVEAAFEHVWERAVEYVTRMAEGLDQCAENAQ
jgi:predicted nucleotidyltransferase component of viral defense system